jgi:hypothetical protein
MAYFIVPEGGLMVSVPFDVETGVKLPAPSCTARAVGTPWKVTVMVLLAVATRAGLPGAPPPQPAVMTTNTQTARVKFDGRMRPPCGWAAALKSQKSYHWPESQDQQVFNKDGLRWIA